MPEPPGASLRQLLARPDRVLAVLGAPNAFHARIMEAAGCEAAFVGTSITGGNYTALPDTGVLTATECVQFGGYIAPVPISRHVMGTARMGTDPATSVVDPWGRLHDVPNVLVADSSVFVTEEGSPGGRP